MSRTMKDSGIPWIGEIPEGWSIDTIGNLYALRNEKVSDKDYPPLSVTKQGIVPQLETAAKTDDGDNRKLVKVGDFAINSRSDRRGSCGISAYDGSVSLINTVITPREQMNPCFYNWLFHSELFADEFYKWGHGIVDDLWTTRWQEMKRIGIITPPLAEQHLIATFLDKKCSEIDSLIDLQEQMIEELKAYKQSVITEAVTKGLNPAAPMRDSGIEWIGQIPEHWIYTKLKHLCSFHNGDRSKNYPCPDEFVDKGVPFYGADSLNDFIANVNYARFITEEKYNLMGGLKIIEGDILYTLRGSTIGKNAIVQQPNGTTASSLMGIRRKDALTNAMYLLYWLHSQNEYIQRDICINGATAPNLSAEDVKEFMLFLPPISEQQAIADYLDKKCGEIDELITIKQQKIESLKEYKKSVIYEYVTGKREV